jgi:PrgI family protein
MMFNVPQFIDVEDKIAGPLTWRQILWMAGMAAVLLVLYNTFDSATFFTLAVPVIIMFALLAFYRPSGISMIQFLMHGVAYLFQPKVSVWERPTTIQQVSAIQPTKKEEETVTHQSFDSKKVHALAETLDHRERM